MKLLIASNNEHKIKEIKNILGAKFEKIVSLKDVNILCDPDEKGTTFYENALIKAQVSSAEGYAVLADDTGLCVDALNGEPGIKSARYAGNHDSCKNREKLLKNLKNETNRAAHFETTLVLLMPNGEIISSTGRADGYILHTPRGNGDFGYDCIFYSAELKKSFGEATETEKNSVSHRARALNSLLSKLNF